MGSRSLATITSAADDITDEELAKAHGTTAAQHADAALARETQTSCQASRLAKCSESGDVLVFSEWIVKTGAIDHLWDAMREAVLEHPLLDDCRNVYFIRQLGTELVKVGFSRDPNARLTMLQCANAWELRIEHLVPTTHFVRLERAIHEYLTDQGMHVRGEWFKLHRDICHADIVRFACARIC